MDFKFPVSRTRPFPGGRNILPIFLKGALIVTFAIMGHRCWFFVNANFTEGHVAHFSRFPLPVGRARGDFPMIAFQTPQGETITFKGALGTHEIEFKIGERTTVIYKKDDPQNAAIFSFWGFWFNHLFMWMLSVLVWFGFTFVYYGYGD